MNDHDFWRSWTAEDRLQYRYFIPSQGRAYHYTNQNGFLGILENLEFWLTDLRFFNDRSEIEHAYAILKKSLKYRLSRKVLEGLERQVLERIAELIDKSRIKTRYVLCFSRKADDLNQWRSYASPGPGYCLGFDIEVLEGFAKFHGTKLRSCLYGEKQQKECVKELVEESIADLEGYFPATGPGEINEGLIEARAISFVNSFGRFAPLFKNQAFLEEEELRIVMEDPKDLSEVRFRSGAVTIIPYRKASLASPGERIYFPEVIHAKQTSDMDLTMLGAQQFLRRNQIDPQILEQSNIPYRETV